MNGDKWLRARRFTMPSIAADWLLNNRTWFGRLERDPFNWVMCSVTSVEIYWDDKLAFARIDSKSCFSVHGRLVNNENWSIRRREISKQLEKFQGKPPDVSTTDFQRSLLSDCSSRTIGNSRKLHKFRFIIERLVSFSLCIRVYSLSWSPLPRSNQGADRQGVLVGGFFGGQIEWSRIFGKLHWNSEFHLNGPRRCLATHCNYNNRKRPTPSSNWALIV